MQAKHQKPDSTDMHRLFVALLPDTRTIRRLASLQAGIKGRKTPPVNLHLTLMFFGNQPRSSIPKLKAFIEALDFKAFDLCIDQRGFFSRLKINWVGTSETPPLLVKLHEDIWHQMVPRYVDEKKRPFRPHITLARNALPSEAPLSEPFIWHIDRLALMESLISREYGKSAVYQILYEKRADSY